MCYDTTNYTSNHCMVALVTGLLTAVPRTNSRRRLYGLQTKKAVSAHFTSEQILPFLFWLLNIPVFM